jgi:ssDNA-binding Zn-finger/Zn-ribbon topoisomerase 1
MRTPNLAPDAVLIACPKCKAWPMALNIVKPSWSSRPMIQFTCPKCHFTSEAERQGYARSGLRPFSSRTPEGAGRGT